MALFYFKIMNLNLFIKILGTIAFFTGAILICFQWKVGATLLIVWLFLTGSVLTWLTSNHIAGASNQKVEEAVRKTIAEGKKRAIIFALIEFVVILLLWVR